MMIRKPLAGGRGLSEARHRLRNRARFPRVPPPFQVHSLPSQEYGVERLRRRGSTGFGPVFEVSVEGEISDKS